MNKDTNWSFDANGSPIEIKNSDFLSDPEKMRDFKKLSKPEFLAFYSYVTEEEYDNTDERCLMNEEKVTKEQVEFWLGSDNTLKEAIEVIVYVANGEYPKEQLKFEILDGSVR